MSKLTGETRGLGWDEGPDKCGPFGPYRQSERGALHAEALAPYKKHLVYLDGLEMKSNDVDPTDRKSVV